MLTKWLQTTTALSTMEQDYLQLVMQRAKYYINDWKEAELRDNFIAPLIHFVGFNEPKYFFSAFSERSLTAEHNGIKLNGKNRSVKTVCKNRYFDCTYLWLLHFGETLVFCGVRWAELLC